MSLNKNADVKGATFGKQDCQLIKEMVEAGITSVATHICITCSLDRTASIWSSLPRATGQATDREHLIQYDKASRDKIVPPWLKNDQKMLSGEKVT